MRTTIRLNEELLTEVKVYAAQSGQTLTAVIEGALRQVLALQNQPEDFEPVEPITYGSGGLLPGVDIDDSAALLELMEAYDDIA
jgi:hypothetical protein